MAGLGVGMTVVTARRGDSVAVPATFGYFTALQVAGYRVLGACGTPSNELVTFLSLLHIAFQPFFVNAFMMARVGAPRHPAGRAAVFVACGLAAVAMLLRLYPFAWAGSCIPGSVMCGDMLCTSAGAWHIAWSAPLNDLFQWREPVLGLRFGWAAYLLSVFVLPVFYGAWPFVVFHALAGPVFAMLTTTDLNEAPAIWCLFSIGIIAAGLSPWLRRRLSPNGGRGQRLQA
jgi:hypothetical protein